MLACTKYVIVATSIAGAALAQAAVVTASPQDVGLGGSGTLTIDGSTPDGSAIDAGGNSLLLSLEVVGAVQSSYGAGTATTTSDSAGYYTSASTAMPLTLLTYDTTSYEISDIGLTGGFTWQVARAHQISTGGSVTVRDLNINLSTQTLYGTVIGSNGVGTITNQALGQFTTSSQTIGSPLTSVTMSGISLNDSFRLAIEKSFGLSGLGLIPFEGSAGSGVPTLTTLGVMTISLASATIDGPPPPWHMTSVPEPSSAALMGLGLTALALSRRRGL